MSPKPLVKLKLYPRRILALLRHPLFYVLTIAGNSVILCGSLLLYHFESATQSRAIDFLDCLLWAVGTVTTVGYADLAPQTFGGKITLLGLMVLGTLFVWSYMGFLVTGLIAPDLSAMEHDLRAMEKEIHGLRVEAEKNPDSDSE